MYDSLFVGVSCSKLHQTPKFNKKTIPSLNMCFRFSQPVEARVKENTLRDQSPLESYHRAGADPRGGGR